MLNMDCYILLYVVPVHSFVYNKRKESDREQQEIKKAGVWNRRGYEKRGRPHVAGGRMTLSAGVRLDYKS